LELTTHLHLVPRLRIREAIPPLPKYVMSWCLVKHGDNFTFNQLTNQLKNSMEHSPSREAIIQLVKKFPAFYGTRMFITMFTRAHQKFLSWVRCTQFTPFHPISLRSILK